MRLQDVARHFGLSRQTISASQTRTTLLRLRSGRHRVTTSAQDRYTRVQICEIEPHLQQIKLATQNPEPCNISDQTASNRLRETGSFPRRPVRRNIFTLRHLTERLQWCQLEDCQVMMDAYCSGARWRTVVL